MLITTSRNPTHSLRRVSKVISLSFPNSQRMNRGSLSLSKIFSYCWNKEIYRLLLIQETPEEDVFLVKAYFIGEKPQSIEANIRLTEIISLRKHNKRHRVLVENVNLHFSEEVDEKIKKRIIDFFQNIIQDSKRMIDNKLLTINFRKEKPNLIVGLAAQHDSSKSIPLYTIHISTECGNNE